LIDFFTLNYIDTSFVNSLSQNPDLNFCKTFKNEDANRTLHFAEYKSMTFKTFDYSWKPKKMVTILGSLHKYYNGGEHNANDFGISQLHKTVFEFCNKFQIPAHLIELQSHEIGLNIPVEFPPSEDFFDKLVVLQSAGGSVKGSPIDSKDRKGFSFGRLFCISNQYQLKIYGKADYLLRVELRIQKVQKLEDCEALNGFKFDTLLDFCNPLALETICRELLIKTFDKILIDEYIQEPDEQSLDNNRISADDYLFYTKYMNPANWTGVKGYDKRKVMNRLNNLFNKYGSYSIKETIISRLNQKLEECIVIDKESEQFYGQLQSGAYITICQTDLNFPSDYHSIEGNLMELENSNYINENNFDEVINLLEEIYAEDIIINSPTNFLSSIADSLNNKVKYFLHQPKEIERSSVKKFFVRIFNRTLFKVGINKLITSEIK
jgi:hypothetical protein